MAMFEYWESKSLGMWRDFSSWLCLAKREYLTPIWGMGFVGCVTTRPSLDCGSQNETGLSGNLGFPTSNISHTSNKMPPILQDDKKVRLPVRGPCACRRGCTRTCWGREGCSRGTSTSARFFWDELADSRTTPVVERNGENVRKFE